MELSKEQQEILQKAVQGHNLVILGQSGTGKTTLSKAIANELTKLNTKVQITATTGIAALNIGGKTIHSWSGISDGRYSNEVLLEKLQNSEHFAVYKNNISNTECIIIDEISMLSRKLFEQVEFLCRKLKNSSLIFGGMQVIAVGDFFQLAPVPDPFKEDSGEYCFLSPVFAKLFAHKFVLTAVLRQKESDFIKAVNDVSKGDLPTDTYNLLKRLRRNLPPGDEPIRLAARNFDCFIFNACKLIDMAGQEYVFNAIDEGDINHVETISAPKTLHIKVGCPVMLIKNLNKDLVNGLRGVVTSVKGDIIGVEFRVPNSENTVFAELKQELFSLYSSIDDRVIASRKQFPICLSFSTTIHKAQGLTLQRVEVDASNIFAPGQLGVAIGRATEKKGLRIVGFNPSSVIKHDQSLYNYYKECDPQITFNDDCSCCKQAFVESVVETENKKIPLEHDQDELSDFSGAELEEIDFLLSEDSDIIEGQTAVDDVEAITADNININELSSLFLAENVNKHDDEISHHFRTLTEKTPNGLKKFGDELYAKIHEIFERNFGNVETKPTQPKQWSVFYSDLYTFSVSQEYTELVRRITVNLPSSMDYEVCSKMFDYIKSLIISKNTQHLAKKLEDTATTSVDLSESRNGKLRYIFGRCIAKSRHHHMKHCKNNMYKAKKKDEVTKSFLKVKLCDSLTSSSHELNETSKYSKSLHETERKQNLSQSLTNINDSTFEFVMELERKRLQVQNQKNFHMHGSDFFNYCHALLLDDKQVFNYWNQLFKDFDYSDTIFCIPVEMAKGCLRNLYEDLILRFFRIADNQFRKNFLQSVGRKKSASLRKRVDNKSSVLKPIPVTVNESNKESSSNVLGISDSSPKKATCSSAKTPTKAASKKCKPGTKKRISDSKLSSSKSKKTYKENETVCPLCLSIYQEGEEWIACDLCDRWYDRRCLTISDNEWNKLEENDWFCPECLK